MQKKRKSEEIRIKYLYRSLVLRGKVNVPRNAAIKMIGPDCAYHLYSFFDGPGGESVSQRKVKEG